MCRPSPCVMTVASGRRGTQDRGSWKSGMSKPRRRVRKAAKKPVDQTPVRGRGLPGYDRGGVAGVPVSDGVAVRVLEVVLGMVVAVAVGWVGDRLNHGKNREAQALERIAAASEASVAAMTFQRSDIEIVEKRTRRSVTKKEEAFIMQVPGCRDIAFVGYDNEIHPDECADQIRAMR